jgi:hypothetical protein
LGRDAATDSAMPSPLYNTDNLKTANGLEKYVRAVRELSGTLGKRLGFEVRVVQHGYYFQSYSGTRCRRSCYGSAK